MRWPTAWLPARVCMCVREGGAQCVCTVQDWGSYNPVHRSGFIEQMTCCWNAGIRAGPFATARPHSLYPSSITVGLFLDCSPTPPPLVQPLCCGRRASRARRAATLWLRGTHRAPVPGAAVAPAAAGAALWGARWWTRWGARRRGGRCCWRREGCARSGPTCCASSWSWAVR